MNFGKYISNWREQHKKTMQELAAESGIDQALISKYESGKRMPSDKHLLYLSAAMDTPLHSLRKEYLIDKIAGLLAYEQNPLEILTAAENRVAYLSTTKALQFQDVDESIKQRLLALDEKQKQWKEQKPLNALQLEKLLAYFDVNYTYDSNRIEGNTLTLQETHLVINEGITIGGKSMREHLEAINHHEAIDFIRGMVNGTDDLSKRNLLDIHRLVLKSIDNENAGVYRKVNVRISGSEHIPPDALVISEQMDDYFTFYTQNKNIMHPVLLAAEMHERLVTIHPFIDGNGRTARLVMNFILLKHGYALAILKGDLDARMAYYKTLEDVQVNNNTLPFYNLIIDKTSDSLTEHLKLT
jgi:Fic family protein